MKMYKLTVLDAQEGAMVSWFSSKTEAEATQKQLKGVGETTLIQSIEFPTGKKAIIEWLNTNYNRDNG